MKFPPEKSEGVIVGADISQEWMLPWWWSRYIRHNHHPVAFIDFGMSPRKKEWCKERGELIPLRISEDFVADKEELGHEFEINLGKRVWECRKVWFKKPFALLKTPFEKTIWIDLDCEIRGSIEEIFSYTETPLGVSMCKEAFVKDKTIYNSGVIAYCGTELVVNWANACTEKNREFSGDQEVFSHLVAEQSLQMIVLPPKYNWSRMSEENHEAVILHWHGQHGKVVIRHQISVEDIPL